jgi:opacity protein-like surface antigen
MLPPFFGATKKETAMKKLLLTAALATSVCATAGATFAQSKRDPDVQKTLQRAYPDAQTHVTGAEQVNGVKVFNVNIADKSGNPSNAQVTEHGDFLIYGAPQRSAELTKLIQDNVGQMFQSKPSDIQLFRSTSYLIDVPVQGQKNQTYQIRLDPVGRVLDIQDAKKTAAERPSEQKPADEKVAKQLEQVARDRYIGKEPQLQRVTQSDVPGFYEADFKGAAVTLNEQGQILQIREDVQGKELPLPVRQALEQLVKSSTRAQRIEEEYFQFTQQSPTGNAVTVKMRPDRDIIDVVNSQAQQEEQAVVAKHKQGAAQPKQPKQPGS